MLRASPEGAASPQRPQPGNLISGFRPASNLGRKGGEQLRPQPTHDRLGEAVRMRRLHVCGLLEPGHGGGLDARPGDRGDRPGGQREDEPFPARRRPGQLDREQALPVFLGQVAGQEGRVGQQDLGPRRERRVGRAGQGPAGFDLGDDPVRVARAPRQGGQQVAAPDLQLRFAGLPSTSLRRRRRARLPAECPPGGMPTRRCRASSGPGCRDPPRRGGRPLRSGTGPLRCTGRWRSTTGRAGRPVPVPPPARRHPAPRTTRRGCWPARRRSDRTSRTPRRPAAPPPMTGPPPAPTPAGTRALRFPRRRRPAGRRRTGGRSPAANSGSPRRPGPAPATCRPGWPAARRPPPAPAARPRPPVRLSQGRMLRAAPTAGPAAAVRPR